jgi:hypothetical protein
MTRRLPTLAPALLLALALAVAAACGGDDGDEGASDDPTTTASSPAGPACSAAGLVRALDPQPGLPAPVEAVRTDIVAAALACDYDALEALGEAGAPTFSFSFGSDTGAAEHWGAQEEAGEQPLRYLVELLGRPSATVETPDGTQVVWPAAFARESWEAVTEEEREALKPLYTDEELEQFADAGAYLGYRVGITSDGDWLFFVAGD